MAVSRTYTSTSILALGFVALVQLVSSYPNFYNKALQEAQIIALEQSNFIVPVDNLVQKIMRDLKAIRSQYAEIQDLTIKRKWVPGEVFVPGRSLTEQQISKIDSSVYGPLVDVQQFDYGTTLVFKKPYHPEVLSYRLQNQFNVNAKPNTQTPKGDTVITYKAKENSYLIEKDPAEFGYPGYSSKYAWEFQVNNNGKVKLRRSLVPGSKL